MKDVLNVSFNALIRSVSVYNMLGQQVVAKTINANEGKIDVSGLTLGTYFVKVAVGDSVKTFKIIKE